MKKVFTSLALLMAFVLVLLTGCGAPSATSTPAKSAPDSAPAPGSTEETSTPEATDDTLYGEPTTMQLTIWGNDTQKALYDSIMDEYEAINPNVTGEVVIIPWDDYQQKLSIMLSGNTEPDVAWIADTMIPQFMEGGQLLDVSSLKDDPEYDFNDINPGSFGPLTLDGTPYGVAFSNPPIILWWNKTMFEAKGLENPNDLAAKGEWTFDKFLEYAEALTDISNGEYGALLGDSGGTQWGNTYPLTKGFGGDYFDSEGNFTYDSEAAAQGMQMYVDMIYNNQVMPMPGDALTFESGKIGMFRKSMAFASTAKDITDFEYDIAPMPVGPNSDGSIEAGFAGYCILKSADDHKNEQRLDLLKFFTNKENMLLTSQYYVPPRKSILESTAYQDIIALPNKDTIQTVVVDQVDNLKTYPGHRNWVKISTEMQSIFDELLMQSIDVPTAIQEIKDRVCPLVNE